MTNTIFSRNALFYPVVFGVWVAIIFSIHGGYRYKGMPFMSAGFEKTNRGMGKIALLRNSIDELQKNFREENNPPEKPHILQNISCAYYDLYHETNDRLFLDSALVFARQSTLEGRPNARFFYNSGRIFTEMGDHAHALQQYDLALQQDPAHLLALSNAGTSSYFAFGKRKESANYFGRALGVDSLLPMCHLILGLINIDDKDSAAAVRDFEKELHADSLALAVKKYPLAPGNVRFAITIARRNLFILFSTKFRDKPKAEEHFRRYVAIELEPAKREDAAKEMKKFWGR